MDSIATAELRQPDWAAVRARYPALAHGAYLNLGSRGVISQAAHAAAAAMLDADRDMRPGAKGTDTLLAATRARFARLIGAGDDEIALTRNVSEGLNAVAGAIDWRQGDNIVLCEELEHANNIYLWLALARRGVTLKSVPPRAGAIDAAAMAAAIDARTRLVTASAVTFTPGYRTDLGLIGAAARAAGALFLVDGVQACGVLPLDVEAECIDALATSTSKGLLGLRGFGFLHVSRRWSERLVPAAVARNGMETGGKHYSEFEGASFALRRDARRFEVGNYNYVGMAAAHAALGEILALGIEQIAARACGLARSLTIGFEKQGWPVCRPPADAATHIVCLGTRGPGGAESTGDARLDALAAALVKAGVTLSIRRRLLRFGFHAYSDETDVATVLDIAARLAPR